MTAPPPYYLSGNRLGSSSCAHQTPSSPSRPSEAAAIAALTRSLGGVSLNSSSEEDSVPSWERRPWDRLLNDELLPVTSKKQATKTLETLVKLMENILSLPADSDGKEKQRTIRLRNSRSQADVVEVKGAYDLLIQSGFRKLVEDFEEKLNFPLLPSSADNESLLSRLRTGKCVLSEALENAKQGEELERTRKEAAEAEKASRMSGVLEDIKADRAMVKARAERERTARRRAREAREIEGQVVRDGRDWDRA